MHSCFTRYTFRTDHLVGKDEYSILNSKHAIGIHGFVLVYSVTSKNSFDMIQIVYDKIVNFCGIKGIPCVIVGSKIDLPQRYGFLLNSGAVPFTSMSLIDRCNLQRVRTLPRQIVQPGLRPARRITLMSVSCLSIRTPNVTWPQLIYVAAKVFELCLAEIERQAPTKAEPQASRCLVM
jgi:Ras homolog enriched in brain